MQFINIICDLYNLGQLKQAPCVIKPAHLWQIQTEQGWFAIKQIACDDLMVNYAIQGEQIAKAFACRGLPIVCSIASESSKLIEIEGRLFLLFNWQAGRTLSEAPALPKHAYCIGNLLGQLHCIKLDMPNVLASRWQQFSAENGWQLVELIQNKKVEKLMTKLSPKFKYWLECFLIAQANVMGAYVISHGDLLQRNVIWDNNDLPWLIDWEAAGWIHPQIELVGVLLNWSGINTGDLNRKAFNNILQGCLAAGAEINIDETVLWASLGSWFNWLLYNLRQLIFAEKQVESEISKTIVVLQRCIDSFPSLLVWINNR